MENSEENRERHESLEEMINKLADMIAGGCHKKLLDYGGIQDKWSQSVPIINSLSTSGSSIDIWTEIAKHLELIDLIRLSRTNREFYCIVRGVLQKIRPQLLKIQVILVKGVSPAALADRGNEGVSPVGIVVDISDVVPNRERPLPIGYSISSLLQSVISGGSIMVYKRGETVQTLDYLKRPINNMPGYFAVMSLKYDGTEQFGYIRMNVYWPGEIEIMMCICVKCLKVLRPLRRNPCCPKYEGPMFPYIEHKGDETMRIERRYMDAQ